MADNEQHRAKLQQLNRNFVRSVEEADVLGLMPTSPLTSCTLVPTAH